MTTSQRPVDDQSATRQRPVDDPSTEAKPPKSFGVDATKCENSPSSSSSASRRGLTVNLKVRGTAPPGGAPSGDAPRLQGSSSDGAQVVDEGGGT